MVRWRTSEVRQRVCGAAAGAGRRAVGQRDNSIKGASAGPTGAPETDIRAQTEGCIENLRVALRREGLELSNLVDVTAFLVNMADYGGFIEAWNEHFDASGPTRTTVAVHQLPDALLAIELKAIATFE